jgi:RND family efflux transporter MFP subunit
MNEHPILRTTMKVALPIIVIAVGVGAAFFFTSLRPEPEAKAPDVIRPLVEIVRAMPEDIVLEVHAQGTVVPRSETMLVTEVSGRIEEVSPALVAGGFFEAGEVLLRLDPVDYRAAVEEARGRVAQAELRLAQEQADAEVAREDWERLGLGEPDDLVLRKPQLADANASLAAAKAGLDKAGRDVERCTVRAPYPGRVRAENVDVGQFATRGQELAKIYAIDYAEVRLPLADAELAFVDLPLAYRHEETSDTPAGQPVMLSTRFAGRTHTWQGHIVRTEGEIDPQTRMVVAVARVEDPYARGETGDRPPLAVGMFVDAVIQGRVARDAFVLPRSVRRGVDRVWLLDEGDRVRFRTVQVLKLERDRVVLSSGVALDDRIIITPIENATDGMLVRVAETTGAQER